MAKGESYVPATDGTRIYFVVDSIEETLRHVVEQGGRQLYPKPSIGELGFVAEVQDCEGNRIALSSSS